MNVVKRLGKRYKRYRNRNRYNKPLLIFIGDGVITAARNFPIIAILIATSVAIIWLLNFEPTKQPEASTQTMIEPSLNQGGSKYVRIGGYNAWKKVVPDPTSLLSSETERFSDSEPVTVVVQSEAPRTAQTDSTPSTSTLSGLTQIFGHAGGAELVDENWILRLKHTSYVIQFSSSTNRFALEKFIPAIDYGEPIAIYPFKQSHTGKTVYGIATGVFENSNAALTAVSKFPAQARVHDPWIRKVSDLAKQIESVTAQSLTP